MSRLSKSVDRTSRILSDAQLSSDQTVKELLAETTQRRRLDLSDMSAAEQAALIGSRTLQALPSVDAIRDRIVEAQAAGRPFVAKFGIDPTSPDVHVGHTVPMMILSRFQRMGHHVVFIVGDMTAKIGDPSGQSSERPALADEEIAANLATYRDQVSPYFDFERAEFRYNSEWLADVRLPQLIRILAKIPASMSLQREDFRNRLAQGHGLSMAELLYSVVMALDSVETGCDLEIGGLDQLLNMQMCRKVMEACGQTPEIVVATSLIEGTDGTGAKMSKSKGNYVGLRASAAEIYGRLMSIPDRLVEVYLKALTEWTDHEIAVVAARQAQGSIHPMDLKRVLAGEVTAAVHGIHAAMEARAEFTAQFSRRSFGGVQSMPSIGPDALVEPLGVLLTERLGFLPSISEARRVARGNGLRFVIEWDGEQDQIVLSEDAVYRTVPELLESVSAASGQIGAVLYLKSGRKVARIDGVAVH
ncbi:MAG: tyrosine--tRNA ligase [Egibacteraceae bacterium]